MFTIGYDPELLCRKNSRYVPAYNYFKSNSSSNTISTEKS